jgi:hypothetical protein
MQSNLLMRKSLVTEYSSSSILHAVRLKLSFFSPLSFGGYQREASSTQCLYRLGQRRVKQSARDSFSANQTPVCIQITSEIIGRILPVFNALFFVTLVSLLCDPRPCPASIFGLLSLEYFRECGYQRSVCMICISLVIVVSIREYALDTRYC